MSSSNSSSAFPRSLELQSCHGFPKLGVAVPSLWDLYHAARPSMTDNVIKYGFNDGSAKPSWIVRKVSWNFGS